MGNVANSNYLHLYTGNGKGKTTAATGLALRGVAAGWQVFIAQFIKDKSSGEMQLLKERFPEVTVENYGRGFFLRRDPEPADFECARQGLRRLKQVAKNGQHRMMIADELIVALKHELVTRKDILELVDTCAPRAELVLTGRYAPPWLIERADLVSEIHPVKHYFQQGVPARKGIEL